MWHSQQSSLRLLATGCKFWDFLSCRTKKELYFRLLLYKVIKLYQLRTTLVSRFLVDQEPYFLKHKKMHSFFGIYLHLQKISLDNPVQQDLIVAGEFNTYQHFYNHMKYFRTK